MYARVVIYVFVFCWKHLKITHERQAVIAVQIPGAREHAWMPATSHMDREGCRSSLGT